MNDFQQALSLARVMLNMEPTVTVEVIRNKVNMVTRMLQDNKEKPLELNEDMLVRQLEAIFNIYIGESSSLEDQKDHQPWLHNRKSEIDWRFWHRYQAFIEHEQGWAPQSVRRLDELTESVLEKLEDPKRSGAWDTRGMLVGDVQSGKTANYIGLICKAADAGYKVIVVLAGLHDSLRSQTQLRLDEGCLGFDTKQNRAFNKNNNRIGAGNYSDMDNIPVAHSLTSSANDGDFSRKVANNVGIALGSDPVILVLKKNAAILRNLNEWLLARAQTVHDKDGKEGKIISNIPLLLIDDEADNASINTSPVPFDENRQPLKDYDVTAINRCIRQLLNLFEKKAYVGYTATPFANIFIYPEAPAERFGDDLFPRSFIISLPRSSNYVGAVTLFGRSADPEIGFDKEIEGLPLIRPISDYPLWMPDGHKKDHFPQGLPDSVKNAIRCFIIACAVRTVRGQSDRHNSMLIHVTRFTAVQEKLADAIKDEVSSLQNRIQYGDGKSSSQIVEELKQIFENDFMPTTDKVRKLDREEIYSVEWSKVKEQLLSAVTKIKVKIINGSSQDALDYRDYPGGINIIAIGGDKLSRGLTLEGLTVSYFLRASRMYDTLMQMGRWFGYRPGYVDLCRLYTTEELISWYEDITFASEELRREFEFMASTGGTPADYGLRVRTHPSGLLITSVNKMRSGTKMKLSYSRDISETVSFSLAPEKIKSNFQTFCSFVDKIGGANSANKTQENYRWNSLSGNSITDLLRNIHTHPDSYKARADLLAAYIERKMKDGELTNWTFVLISKRSGIEKQISDCDVHLLKRDFKKPLKLEKCSIGRLVSPQDEWIDLSQEERNLAISQTVEAMKKDEKNVAKQNHASGKFIRKVRNKRSGLFLLYPLEPPDPSSTPIMSFAISFPESGNPEIGIEYTVNNVYWKQEFEGE